MIQNDKARYSYDAFNRTTKVETFDGNIQLNRYDAEGLRYEMEENGNLVQFIFNQEQEVVTEEDSTGITRLIRDTELIARSTDTVRTYYHYASDEMGSTTHIVDEAGAVQNWYEYDAWGNITAKQEAIPNRYTYYGQQLDPITQQYYLRARFYNPVIGRFTQEDAYRGDGLNLYAYCANNPVYYVDPSGYTFTKCQKDAYDKLRNEGFTAAEAYQAIINRIGVKPQAMTDRQMQMAIDYIYKAGYKEKYYGRSVQALTITPEGRVILSANRQVPHADSVSAAKEMFGEYLPDNDIVRGTVRSNYQNLIYIDSETGEVIKNGNHAEARAVAHILGDLARIPLPKGALQGTRQATSAYACNGCAYMQKVLGIINVTGTKRVEGEGKIQRLYY